MTDSRNQEKRALLNFINARQKRYRRSHCWETATGLVLEKTAAATLQFYWMRDLLNVLSLKAAWLIKPLARRFIAGDTIEEALNNKKLRRFLRQIGASPIFAYETESVFNRQTAEKNLRSFQYCLAVIKNQNEKGMISIKPSSLALFEKDPELYGYSPPQINRVKDYLRQLLAQAAKSGVGICLDMESFIYKDPTFQIFISLLDEYPPYANHLQLAFQCYLKDSPQDILELANWAKGFHRRSGRKIKLRLVKGANLITDRLHACLGLHQPIKHCAWHRQQRLALNPSMPLAARWLPDVSPIVESKENTQRQFLEIMNFLERQTTYFNVAYGTMNPDTVAHIICVWQKCGRNPRRGQIQTLLGMNNSLKFALKELVNQQIYIPYAPLAQALPYMSRRFLELKDSQKGAMPIMEYRDEKLIQIN